MAVTKLFPINFCIPGDIVDTDTDLLKIQIPNRSGTTIKKLVINSMVAASGTPTVSVENSSNGVGDNLVATFVNTEFDAVTSGILSTGADGSIWIRSGTPGDLADINITIHLLNS